MDETFGSIPGFARRQRWGLRGCGSRSQALDQGRARACGLGKRLAPYLVETTTRHSSLNGEALFVGRRSGLARPNPCVESRTSLLGHGLKILMGAIATRNGSGYRLQRARQELPGPDAVAGF